MNFPIDWRMIGVFVALFLAWSGLLIRIIKWLLDKNQKQGDGRWEEINRRLESLENATQNEAGEWQKIEREMLELRTELAKDYVRREDLIRVISTLDARIETMSVKIDSIKDSLINLNSRR